MEDNDSKIVKDELAGDAGSDTENMNGNPGTAPESPETAPEEQNAPAAEEPVEAEEVNTDGGKNKARVSKHIKGAYDYVETFCAALAVLLVVFLFIFRYTAVEGDSMLPTLHGGESSNHADRLIISDLFYTPKTGDIVVVMTNASDYPLIKRVIATEGQTVRINFNTWEVTVDGVTLDETYIKKIENAPMASGNMRSMYGIDANGVCEFTVSKGKVFVMGDNRNNSKDSRYQGVGEQDVDHILGRVILRLYPFSEFGKPAGT